MLDTLKTFDKTMENAPFSAAFSEAAQEPMDVGTEINFGTLTAYGYLVDGQPVTYIKRGEDGIEVRVFETVGDL